MEPISIQDEGLISVKVKSLDGQEVVHQIDLWCIRIAFETVEKKHDVKKGYIVTPQFCTDLAKAAAESGVPGLSPHAAFNLWVETADRWNQLKKTLAPTQTSQESTTSTPTNSTLDKE